MYTRYHFNQRQQSILEYLSDQKQARSVSDIEEYLVGQDQDASRPTLVRDLNGLVEAQLLIRIGEGRGVVYNLSPGYRLMRPIDIDTYFESDQDHREGQNRFQFELLDLISQVTLFTLDEVVFLEKHHQLYLDYITTIPEKTLQKRELERIMIEFSWKSSQIEGNTYSLLDTEALIKNHQIAEGKTQEETQMILNHKEAFTFIWEEKHQFQQISLAQIEYVHRLLVQDLNISSELRKHPVGIIGTNYRPLDNVFQVQEAIDTMIALINQKNSFFEKSFIALIFLSYIQAFQDGNKRTSRLISNAVLMAHGTLPMSYRAVNESEYKKAIIVFYEQGNISPMKDIFLSQYAFAVEQFCGK